jgi:hypothetical protein
LARVNYVNRKVYFFRISTHDDHLSKIEAAISHIVDLPFNEQGRYQAQNDGVNFLVLFAESTTFPIKLQFGKIRRDNLPVVEQAGNITPLKIPASAGLLDWSHIAIYPDGYVVAEFHNDAPRIRRLGQYLYFKSNGALGQSIKFLPLYQRNVLDELDKFESISILELEASSDDVDALAEADVNIGSAFKACRAAGASKRSQLVLSSGKRSGSKLKSLAKSLFRNPISRESLSKLKIVGGKGINRKPLDMLEEYLIVTEAFVLQNSRSKSIDTAHAYEVLDKAYHENKHRFVEAATAHENIVSSLLEQPQDF